MISQKVELGLIKKFDGQCRVEELLDAWVAELLVEVWVSGLVESVIEAIVVNIVGKRGYNQAQNVELVEANVFYILLVEKEADMLCTVRPVEIVVVNHISLVPIVDLFGKVEILLCVHWLLETIQL